MSVSSNNPLTRKFIAFDNVDGGCDKEDDVVVDELPGRYWAFIKFLKDPAGL
jgi:hypothetical protein